MTVPRFLARNPALRALRASWWTLRDQYGLGLRWVGGLGRLCGFWWEFYRFRAANKKAPFSARIGDVLPLLTDRTATTPIEPIYFLQDTWFARKMAEQRPAHHVDVGSSAKSMALVAQFIPVTFIDIRPVEIDVPGFSFRKGSVLALPFPDRSVASLSSICVIEHIGLGRYGDPSDTEGSEKAAVELTRILANEGNLYVTVPVDSACRVYFNAHRAFTRSYLLGLFPGLTLVEERYIYGRKLCLAFDPSLGFGTGLFHFRRT